MSPTPITVRRRYLTHHEGIDGGAAVVATAPHHAELVRVSADVPTWRALYRLVGEAWHWHDRDAWPDDRLMAHLARTDVHVYSVTCTIDGIPIDPAGFVELERHEDGSVEIAYLGLAAEAIGRGLGKWLVHAAVAEAQAMAATRIWLHTCTLDHPAALKNYEQCGFQVEREETYETVI